MSLAGYTVIGAKGFIGARLVETLRADGHEVYAPGRDDPLTARDLGRVVYCAGLTGDYRARPFDTVEAHVSLLSYILDRGSFDRLVYLSSTRVYEGNPQAVGREHASLTVSPGDPEHLYELSKLLGENLTVNRSGGRGVAARLSYVFDWTADAAGFLSDWLKHAAQARVLEIDSSPGDGRDYIHRDDVTAALRGLADGEATGIVNVASGRILSNARLAEIFAAAGWTVGFSRSDDSPRSLPADIGRLSALGLAPRDPLGLIAGYLASLRR